MKRGFGCAVRGNRPLTDSNVAEETCSLQQTGLFISSDVTTWGSGRERSREGKHLFGEFWTSYLWT
ncbi:hypothetical protein STEG23_036978, partial [Scotinomys teguina]